MKREGVVYCAAHRCREVVKPGMLMCRDHWFSLPARLRSEIGHSWRARRMRDYAAAVQAALELIAGQENPFQEVFTETRFTGKPEGGRALPPSNLIVPPFGGVAV